MNDKERLDQAEDLIRLFVIEYGKRRCGTDLLLIPAEQSEIIKTAMEFLGDKQSG